MIYPLTQVVLSRLLDCHLEGGTITTGRGDLKDVISRGTLSGYGAAHGFQSSIWDSRNFRRFQLRKNKGISAWAPWEIVVFLKYDIFREKREELSLFNYHESTVEMNMSHSG